jgi:hypothetical protein
MGQQEENSTAVRAGKVQADQPINTNPSSLQIALTNTVVGPMGASAQAQLQSSHEPSPGTTSVSLRTQGLWPGHYELRVVRRSDGAIVPVAVIAISDPTLAPDKQANDSKKQDNSTHQTEVLTSLTHVQLPEGWDLGNVQQLVVSTMNGNDVLAGAAPVLPQAHE